jgi:hypothetical protein
MKIMGEYEVLIAVMSHTGWVHNTVAFMLIDMIRDNRMQKQFHFIEHRPVDAARNYAVERFLESDCTHLMMIDNDNACTKNPLDLIGKSDIIMLPTPMKKGGIIRLNVEAKEEGEFVPITRGGTGICIISRRAATDLKKPLFQHKYDKKGLVDTGEDVYFCQQAIKKGIQPYTHMGYPCLHYNEINLWDVFVMPRPDDISSILECQLSTKTDSGSNKFGATDAEGQGTEPSDKKK